MPYKPLRQRIAEKVHPDIKEVNPSQLGDPIDLKAETSDGVDPDKGEGHFEPPRRPLRGHSWVEFGDDKSNKASQNVDCRIQGITISDREEVVGIGDGAGALGGFMKPREREKSKL
jgi:hypothetical protein